MRLSRSFVVYSGAAAILVTGTVGVIIGYAVIPLINQIDQHMSMRFTPASNLPEVIPQDTHTMGLAVAAVFMVCLFFFLIQIVFIHRSVTRPMRNLIDFAVKLSKGDFTVELDSDRNAPDEIAELMRSLNYMRDRMQSYITRLQATKAREQSARRRAESVNTLKSDFLMTMALELKNPLNTIMGFSRLMGMEAEHGKIDDETLRKCRIIYNSAESLNLFIDKLLNLSRLDAGDNPAKPVLISSAEFIQDLAEINRQEAGKRRIALSGRYSPEQPEELCTDRDILLNGMSMLISSMIRCSPEGTEIQIGCGLRGEELEFFIKAPNNEKRSPCLASIYRKNFMSSSSTRISQLSGVIMVNLAIAKYSFDMLNARVEVDGSGEQGYVFRILFSAGEVSADNPVQWSPTQHYATNFDDFIVERKIASESNFALNQARQLKVLLFDAEGSSGGLFTELVKNGKHILTLCNDPAVCGKHLDQGDIDVLIVDDQIQNGNAAKLTAHAISNPSSIRPYIMIISNIIADFERQRLIVAGADECVEKPLDIVAMLKRLDKLSHQPSRYVKESATH